MRFIARQPVFDRELNVFGYELLFRAAMEDFARIEDSERAVSVILDNSVLWGMDRLCQEKLAFVNCTREALVSGVVEMLPPHRTVLEVLEDVRADDQVIEACRQLRLKGYRIALDDVTSVEEVEPYIDVADIVKVDLRLTSPPKRAEMAATFADAGITALAEKVETPEEYRESMKMGYTLFQGFFFCRPEVMRTNDIPALQATCMRLLSAIQKPELDFDLIERLIRVEPSLCFRLLRYLNSPLFAFSDEIASVRHALSLLGEREIKNWLLVAMTASLGENKPRELVLWALVRAYFCEALAQKSPWKLDGAFLMGMLSAFPALLQIPLDDLLERLPVAPEIKAALGRGSGRHGALLEIVAEYEAGNWYVCNPKAQSLGLHDHVLVSCYLHAVDCAHGIESRPVAAPVSA